MDWLRRNLTNMFFILLPGFLLLQTIQLGTGVFSVLHIGEEGAIINEADRQRMRTLLLPYIVRQTLGSDNWRAHKIVVGYHKITTALPDHHSVQ